MTANTVNVPAWLVSANAVLDVTYPDELLTREFPEWRDLADDDIEALVEHLLAFSPLHAAAVWRQVMNRLSGNTGIYVPLLHQAAGEIRVIDLDTLDILQHAPLSFQMEALLRMDPVPDPRSDGGRVPWWERHVPALELTVDVLIELEPEGARLFLQDMQEKFDFVETGLMFRTVRRYLLRLAHPHRIPRIKPWQLERAGWVADQALQWLADDGYTVARTELVRHQGEPQVRVVIQEGDDEVIYVPHKDSHRFTPAPGETVIFRRGNAKPLPGKGNVYATWFYPAE